MVPARERASGTARPRQTMGGCTAGIRAGRQNGSPPLETDVLGKYARQHARHGVREDDGRQLAAGQHEIADGNLFHIVCLEYALIHAPRSGRRGSEDSRARRAPSPFLIQNAAAGDIYTICGRTPVCSATASKAEATGSAISSMPLPPPKVQSSTRLCAPSPQRRSWWQHTANGRAP